jgi:hypothetical protein
MKMVAGAIEWTIASGTDSAAGLLQRSGPPLLPPLML